MISIRGCKKKNPVVPAFYMKAPTVPVAASHFFANIGESLQSLKVKKLYSVLLNTASSLLAFSYTLDFVCISERQSCFSFICYLDLDICAAICLSFTHFIYVLVYLLVWPLNWHEENKLWWMPDELARLHCIVLLCLSHMVNERFLFVWLCWSVFSLLIYSLRTVFFFPLWGTFHN